MLDERALGGGNRAELAWVEADRLLQRARERLGHIAIVFHEQDFHGHRLNGEKGEAYTHEGIEGKLYTNTLVWEFVYNEDDVREFTKTHKFFVANNTIEPDPEATEMFGKNFKSLNKM